MNKEITKAYQTAELLCQDLLAVYRKVNQNRPKHTQKLAEMYVIGLLGKAGELKLILQELSNQK